MTQTAYSPKHTPPIRQTHPRGMIPDRSAAPGLVAEQKRIRHPYQHKTSTGWRCAECSGGTSDLANGHARQIRGIVRECTRRRITRRQPPPQILAYPQNLVTAGSVSRRSTGPTVTLHT